MHIRWRGLELPGSVVPDQKTLSGTYGKFVAEPFERGFGTTVGNSLRRVLLSSLEGSAVTQIKMAGALHEFTTIKGVLEDVTDIVLAVKSLVVKNHSDSTRVIRVERSTKGPITGGDVITDDAVEVVNKDLVLATLTDDVPFELEMVVENGRGYVPSSEHTQVSQEIGIIPVDAVFSPVTRVKYEVEETRVGQKTNYDRLTLEIWTNGTVTPEMALVEAAKILRLHQARPCCQPGCCRERAVDRGSAGEPSRHARFRSAAFAAIQQLSRGGWYRHASRARVSHP